MTGSRLRLMALAAATLVLATSFATHSHSRPAKAAQQAGPAAGPKNLKVLPANISGEQLRGIMRGFTVALGVQCNFCHVRGDFAADTNPHKDVARGMLRMVQHINSADLKAIPGAEDAKVTCYTCHRGAAEPATEPPAPAAATPPAGAPPAPTPAP